MSNLTREQILARKLGRGTATLPDGSTVGIRALTRDEAITMQELKTLAEKDDFVVATGMTDPVMTLEEVAAWGAHGAAGDVTAVSQAIARLSGMVEGAGKSGVVAAGE